MQTTSTDLSELNNLNITPKCIIYTRCSTKGQDKDNKHGSATQLAQCKEYAEQNGFSVSETIQENGSAADMKIQKMELWKLIVMNDNIHTIHLLVADASRLCRNVGMGGQILNKCIEKKITVHCIREGVNSSNLLGQRAILDAILVSHHEVKNMQEKARNLVRIKREEGASFGRMPYGKRCIQRMSKKNYPIKEYVDDEYECAVIRLVKHMFLGEEKTRIYEQLNEVLRKSNLAELQPETNAFQAENYDPESATIFYKNFTVRDICNNLNTLQIKRRGKNWTVSNIYAIVKNKKDKDVVPIIDDTAPEFWTTDHLTVGTSVAKYFFTGTTKELFIGKVILFLPEKGYSLPLYKIEYEDGDREDFDINQLIDGIKKFKTLIPSERQAIYQNNLY